MMKSQHGYLLTTLIVLCGLASKAHSLGLDDVLAGMSDAQIEDMFNDVTAAGNVNEKQSGQQDYDYDMLADYLQNIDQPTEADVPQGQPGAEAPGAKAHGNSMLPAYCDPPNPCPIGYTAEDGCIEDFENTSEFSRTYQASQKCICDTEHMFDCPEQDVHRGPEDIDAVNFLASIPGLVNPSDADNPFLDGQKLPVAAKKGVF